MAKQQAESINRLSVFWLKKHGYMSSGWHSGGIKWTHGSSESSIGFIVSIDENEGDHVKLQYINTDSWTGERESMDLRIELTATPCNFGGKRYWFICPLTKSGQYCGRRVGVLFGIGKWFGCRCCGNIAYASQMLGGKYKGFVSIPDIDRAEAEVKRYYYRGRPTRKHKKLIRLNEKFESNFARYF